jgi:D-psicose/D-tagatose/L-ribulose 3-epimerase
MQNAIDVCEILGANPLIGPFASPCGVLVGRGRTQEEWNWCVDIMQQSSDYAQKAGINLAFEAINRFETFFINTVQDAYQLAKDVDRDNFGIVFDTFHANIEEENLAVALSEVIDKVYHVHISENHRGIPGAGHIRFGDVFKVLRSHNYDRWLTIEAFGNAVPEVAAATCIWRPIVPSNEKLCKKGLNFITKQWQRSEKYVNV